MQRVYCILLAVFSVAWYKYILLTKREGSTGRISARGLDSPEKAWLIRD